jgi:uncharacterized integral membrane protein
VTEEPGRPAAGGSDHVAKLVATVVVIGLLVAFILGNSEQVRVSFVFFHARFSLIWVLLVTNLLGFAAGYLIKGRLAARRKRRPKT